jgi:hypothetical protein
VASVWIRTRQTKDGAARHLVEYRAAGRSTTVQHGGSFKTRRLATMRAAAIELELAGPRIPDLAGGEAERPKLPTLLEASEAWRASRVDVDEDTGKMHLSAFVRVFKVKPELRTRRLDELTVDDVAELVAARASSCRRNGRRISRRRSPSTSSASPTPSHANTCCRCS